MNSNFQSAHLMYDVLSGEFRPPTDPLRGTHTLARLALATFKKGRDLQTTRDTYRYEPSWATGTFVTAEALKSGALLSVTLQSRLDSDWASFTQSRSFGRANFHIEDSNGIEIVLPLELSIGLDGSRKEAAAIAQTFYDRLTVVTPVPAPK